MAEVVVRSARAEELAAVAVLAGKLVRMHHEVDRARFFLPDRVEAGYEWWLGKELLRKEARVLVADHGGRIVGYSYGAPALEPVEPIDNVSGSYRERLRGSVGWRTTVCGKRVKNQRQSLLRTRITPPTTPAHATITRAGARS